MRLCSLALFVILAGAQISSQSPVATDKKGKKASTAETSARVKATKTFKSKTRPRGVINGEHAHPTIKAFSSVSSTRSSKRYPERKALFFESDPFLKEAAKADTVEQYVAHFNQLRPSKDGLDAKTRKGIGYSVSALMASHMKHLKKSEEFKRLAKGAVARLSWMSSSSNRAKNLEGVDVNPKVTKRAKPQRRFKTQQRNASIFKADLERAGIKLGDDPIKFEHDTRVLIDGYGKMASSWKLRDFLEIEGKDQEFIDRVRNLRLYNNNQTSWRKQKQSKGVSSMASTSHDANSKEQGATTDHQSPSAIVRGPMPSSTWKPTQGIRPSSPTFADAIASLNDREDASSTGKDYNAHINQSGHQVLPTNADQHQRSSSVSNHDYGDDATFWRSMMSS